MAGKLTNKNKNESKANKLTRVQNIEFKIAIAHSLENRYCFKDLKREGLIAFNAFIEATVGRKLTISQVDKLFLRKRGDVKQTLSVQGVQKEVVHYGKDRTSFRIFGYYNSDGYFVLTHIDQNHKINS